MPIMLRNDRIAFANRNRRCVPHPGAIRGIYGIVMMAGGAHKCRLPTLFWWPLPSRFACLVALVAAVVICRRAAGAKDGEPAFTEEKDCCGDGCCGRPHYYQSGKACCTPKLDCCGNVGPAEKSRKLAVATGCLCVMSVCTNWVLMWSAAGFIYPVRGERRRLPRPGPLAPSPSPAGLVGGAVSALAQLVLATVGGYIPAVLSPQLPFFTFVYIVPQAQQLPNYFSLIAIGALSILVQIVLGSCAVQAAWGHTVRTLAEKLKTWLHASAQSHHVRHTSHWSQGWAHHTITPYHTCVGTSRPHTLTTHTTQMRSRRG